MKKLFLFNILFLFSVIVFGQEQLKQVKPFVVGSDSLASVKQKIKDYDYIGFEQKIGSDVLYDVSVGNYHYKGRVGQLELFFGNDKLYYVRFTCNSDSDIYWSQDDSLFTYYEKYWD